MGVGLGLGVGFTGVRGGIGVGVRVGLGLEDPVPQGVGRVGGAVLIMIVLGDVLRR